MKCEAGRAAYGSWWLRETGEKSSAPLHGLPKGKPYAVACLGMHRHRLHWLTIKEWTGKTAAAAAAAAVIARHLQETLKWYVCRVQIIGSFCDVCHRPKSCSIKVCICYSCVHASVLCGMVYVYGMVCVCMWVYVCVMCMYMLCVCVVVCVCMCTVCVLWYVYVCWIKHKWPSYVGMQRGSTLLASPQSSNIFSGYVP